MKRAAIAVLAGIAVFGAAPTAHADQSSINAAIHDSWESTCNQFRHELTGDPANDLTVLEAVAQNLANFYNMSLHDGAFAAGGIVADHCPQYEPNLEAAKNYAEKNDL